MKGNILCKTSAMIHQIRFYIKNSTLRKIILTWLLTISFNAKSQFTDLYDLNASGSEGYSSLVSSGSVLYGTTSSGGANNGGYIFSINTDGTGFTKLYDFLASYTFPCGSLILENGVLYGMTTQGGTLNKGMIFSINYNGTGFTSLHNFSGQGTDGSEPNGSLVISGNKLYGMTTKGGTNATSVGGYGIIFVIKTDGTGFNNLYNFTSATCYPYGSLIISGSMLYGMTSGKCLSSAGNVFSIDTSGNGYVSLHNFSGSDGKNPNGSLTMSGNVLYGITALGGQGGKGNIFKINENGTGFQSIFDSLNGGNYSWSYGSLTLVGNVLYGKSNVNIYSIKTDGTGYNWYNWNLYGSQTGSYDPQENGNLVLSGGNLYGINLKYGGANNNGLIFSFTPGTFTSIKNTADPNIEEFSVSPNPTKGMLNIDLNGSYLNENYGVTITNTVGQTIFIGKIKTERLIINLFRQTDAGLYYLTITDSNNRIVNCKKIIIE